MRALVQRVSKSSVTVDGQVVGAIGSGVTVLLGIRDGDTEEEARWLAPKIANLRIFPDDDGKLNRSVLDIGGEALVVSQFTLYADCRKGRRPSFTSAARPEVADPLFEHFVELLRAEGLRVKTGIFQTEMLVEIHNDGPVTVIVEKEHSDN